MNNISLVDPTRIESWNESISSFDNVTFFHTSNWAKTLSDCYRYRVKYLIKKNHHQVIAVFPIMELHSFITGKRGVSLPFSDYCQPLFHEEATSMELLNAAMKFGNENNWKFLELRGIKFEVPGADKKNYYLHRIKISNDLDYIFKSFRKSTRQNIQKATRLGLSVSFENSSSALREFYRLHCANRRRIGIPPQPYRFFRSIYTNILSKNLGHVVLVRKNGRVTSASICFYFKNTVILKYVANDYRYQIMRSNNLLVWEMIKYYSLKGFETFCFGKTEVNNLGLIQFKKGFRPIQLDHSYCRIPLQKKQHFDSDWDSKSYYRKALKSMPTTALRMMGELLYKHIG